MVCAPVRSKLPSLFKVYTGYRGTSENHVKARGLSLRTGAQSMFYLTCTMITSVDLAHYGEWSGGAKVLGKLPVPGRPTILITVGQGPTALAVGAGGVVWTFLLSSILSLLFLPLFGRRPDID